MGDEFAGATSTPDGKVLFVNIQASSGLTFAIWGLGRRARWQSLPAAQTQPAAPNASPSLR